MNPEIRKIVTYDEEVLIEGFKTADHPLRMFAVAAVITNPWSGRYVEDLKPEIMAFGPKLGEMLTSDVRSCSSTLTVLNPSTIHMVTKQAINCSAWLPNIFKTPVITRQLLYDWVGMNSHW